MQYSNERLTTVPGSHPGYLIDARESERRGAGSRPDQSAFACIQPATALPMAGPESSWMKCEPGTVTSV